MAFGSVSQRPIGSLQACRGQAVSSAQIENEIYLGLGARLFWPNWALTGKMRGDQSHPVDRKTSHQKDDHPEFAKSHHRPIISLNFARAKVGESIGHTCVAGAQGIRGIRRKSELESGDPDAAASKRVRLQYVPIMLNNMRRTATNITKAWRTALCRSQCARHPYRINRIVRSSASHHLPGARSLVNRFV